MPRDQVLVSNEALIFFLPKLLYNLKDLRCIPICKRMHYSIPFCGVNRESSVFTLKIPKRKSAF